MRYTCTLECSSQFNVNRATTITCNYRSFILTFAGLIPVYMAVEGPCLCSIPVICNLIGIAYTHTFPLLFVLHKRCCVILGPRYRGICTNKAPHADSSSSSSTRCTKSHDRERECILQHYATFNLAPQTNAFLTLLVILTVQRQTAIVYFPHFSL